MPDISNLSDPVFGTLAYNEKLQTFGCAADWLGQSIRVSFSIEGREPASALKLTHGLWLQKEILDSRIRVVIVKELLPLKNQSWLEDGEAIVTEAELLARIQPEGVNFYIDDGGAAYDFFFADGDLFGGHSVVVQGDSEDGTLKATLFG